MRNRQLLIKMNKEVVRVLSDLRFYKELNMIGISLCIFLNRPFIKRSSVLVTVTVNMAKDSREKIPLTLLKAETNCKNSSTQ